MPLTIINHPYTPYFYHISEIYAQIRDLYLHKIEKLFTFAVANIEN